MGGLGYPINRPLFCVLRLPAITRLPPPPTNPPGNQARFDSLNWSTQLPAVRLPPTARCSSDCLSRSAPASVLSRAKQRSQYEMSCLPRLSVCARRARRSVVEASARGQAAASTPLNRSPERVSGSAAWLSSVSPRRRRPSSLLRLELQRVNPDGPQWDVSYVTGSDPAEQTPRQENRPADHVMKVRLPQADHLRRANRTTQFRRFRSRTGSSRQRSSPAEA